jgi:carbamate kinase
MTQTEPRKRVAVVAIGGNSLISDKAHQTVEDQYEAAGQTARHIAMMIKDGWDVAISHGNGPQVGFILRRSELAAKVEGMHEVPLDVCGADSQGAIGYALQQNLYNDFREMGIDKSVATIVTQTEVSAADPAFQNPTKPIGGFMSAEEAERRRTEEGWEVVEDAGRGWRRVVASPQPMRIVEEEAVKTLINAGIITITVGGGGIPVVADEEGYLHGTAAVIDKDLASALLANVIGADMLIISTAVEKVALNFGKPDQQWVDEMTLEEARAYLAEGSHFAKGSMAPKIQAVIQFMERGGEHAIITNPENVARALAGETGTHIVRQRSSALA